MEEKENTKVRILRSYVATCIQVRDKSMHTHMHMNTLYQKYALEYEIQRGQGQCLLSHFCVRNTFKGTCHRKNTFFNNCKSWLYIQDIWFVCPRYFLLAPQDSLIALHCYSPCHVAIPPWTSSKSCLALWLPVSFNHWVALEREWLEDEKKILILTFLLPEGSSEFVDISTKDHSYCQGR